VQVGRDRPAVWFWPRRSSFADRLP
jgi:hypothetical protein